MSFEYYEQTLSDLENKITEQNPPYSRDMLRVLDSFLDTWFMEVQYEYYEKKNTYTTLRRYLSGRTKFKYRQIVGACDKYASALEEEEMSFMKALDICFPQYADQIAAVINMISETKDDVNYRNDLISRDQDLYLENYDAAIQKYMDFLNSIATLDQSILNRKKNIEDRFNRIIDQIKQECPVRQLSSKLTQLDKEYKQLTNTGKLLQLKLRYLGTPVYQDILNLYELFSGKDCFSS